MCYRQDGVRLWLTIVRWKLILEGAVGDLYADLFGATEEVFISNLVDWHVTAEYLGTEATKRWMVIVFKIPRGVSGKGMCNGF